VPQFRFSATAAITMVHVVVSVFPFLSTAFEVNVKAPAAVGVPLIVPVELFSVKPPGSEPEIIE
jgi:hypothetical protein